MRKLLGILLCIFCIQIFYAQNSNLDITQVLEKIEKDIENNSAFNLSTILKDFDSAFNIIDDKNSNEASNFYLLKGKALEKAKEYKVAIIELTKSLEIKKLQVDENYEQILNIYARLANIERKSLNYKAAVEKINEGIAYTKSNLPSNSVSLAEAYYTYGKIERKKGNYQQAIIFAKKSIAIGETNPNLPPKLLAEFYNNLGTSYKRNGQEVKGIEAFEKTLEIHKKNNLVLGETGNVTYNLGNAFLSIGAYNKAMKYYEDAIEIFGNLNQKRVIPRCYVGQGIIYRNWGDYDRALTYYQKSLALFIEVNESYPPNIATNYMNIGNCYRSMKNYPKARENIEIALTMYRDFFKKPHGYIGRGLAHLGQVEKQLGNYDLALLYFDDAIENHSISSGSNHSYIANIIASKADVYKEQDKLNQALILFDQALQHAQRNGWNQPITKNWIASKAEILIETGKELEALALLDSTIQQLDFDKNNIANLRETSLYLPIIELMKTKGKVYDVQFSKSGKIADLENATIQYELGVKILFQLRENFRTENSRQFVLEKQFDLISKTVESLKMLFDKTDNVKYLDKAFQIAEKTKGLILMEAIEKKRATTLANINPSILEREHHLRGNLELFEKLYYKQQSKKEPNDSLLQELNQKIFDYRNEYFAFQDTLNLHLKSFSKEVRHEANITSISQYLVEQNSATIEYFLADSNLYIFTFFDNQHYFDKVELPSDFKNQLLTYCESLASPTSNFEKTKGTFISKFLLKKSFERLEQNETIQKITIIPDIWLGYLPFETLPIPSQSSKMLVEKYDVSYAYAANLLMAQKNNSFQNANKSIATFAPQYQAQNQYIAAALRTRSGKNLSDLPGAKREAELIAQLFGGDAFTGNKVTESQFRKNAKDYKLLHLSMHADMDDVNPMYSHFIFNTEKDTIHDGVLTASELYNLQLNADLAVLSACNTGFGTIKKGEGIMSLSRAFRYAGVPSTVMSLWKVPDDATSKIMSQFYKFLKEGETKDSALRRAKLAYLDQTITPEQKHPFYWAGFVAAGDMGKISVSSFDFWNWGMRLIFVIGFISLFRFFRKK